MNAPPPLPEKPPMPSPSWTRALGGVWRLTYWRALTPGSLGVLAGLLALFALLTVTNTRVGDQAAFQQWGVRFYLGFAVPVVAFLTTAGLVRDDMTPATVDYVFTRSLRRGTFVLLRFLCHAACLELQCLAALCVFWIIGLVRHVPDAGALVPTPT